MLASDRDPRANWEGAEIISEFPRHGEAKYRLGLIAEAEGESVGALELYEEAESIWPTHPPYAEAVSRVKAGYVEEPTWKAG